MTSPINVQDTNK